MLNLAEYLMNSFRSSHQRCSLRKSVLRNFAKLTGKHLCQIRCQTPLLKKRLKVFSCEFCKIVKNTFSQNTSGGCICSFHAYLCIMVMKNPIKVPLVSINYKNFNHPESKEGFWRVKLCTSVLFNDIMLLQPSFWQCISFDLKKRCISEAATGGVL